MSLSAMAKICIGFKSDCFSCADAGHCSFSPDYVKFGTCLPDCDMDLVKGKCYSPPKFNRKMCQLWGTDCEADFDTCEACLSSGICVYSPDTGKAGSCLHSCNSAVGRCFKKGSSLGVCTTDEPSKTPSLSPTESPTMKTHEEIPTFVPVPTIEPADVMLDTSSSSPTFAGPTPEPTFAGPTPEPTVAGPTLEPTEFTTPDPTSAHDARDDSLVQSLPDFSASYMSMYSAPLRRRMEKGKRKSLRKKHQAKRQEKENA